MKIFSVKLILIILFWLVITIDIISFIKIKKAKEDISKPPYYTHS